MNTPEQGAEPGLAPVVRFFEPLTPASVADIGKIYHAQARFKDPFNEVRGLAPIQRIFSHIHRRCPCMVRTTDDLHHIPILTNNACNHTNLFVPCFQYSPLFYMKFDKGS
jgi:hypothetical protein